MSIIDHKRLPPDIFKLDAERMRQGWYSDHYLNNITRILRTLAEQAYGFQGHCPELEAHGVDVAQLDVGNIEVDMPYFTRREPFSVVAGVDHALAMFKLCTGYIDAHGRFVNTFDHLAIDAVHDGTKVAPWQPVMRVCGRYRDLPCWRRRPSQPWRAARALPPMSTKRSRQRVASRYCFSRRALISTRRSQGMAMPIASPSMCRCNPQRIAQCEELGMPVDIYRVGSYLFEGSNNDYTADVVRVKIDGTWYDMAKIGRQAFDNPQMQRVVY